MKYKGYGIEPKRDFGGIGYLSKGRCITEGWIVVKGYCNAMPGAIWFETIEEAKESIDILIEHGENGFWAEHDRRIKSR